jgi:NAD+ kinase
VIARVGIVAKRGLTAAVPHLERVIEWLKDRRIEPLLEVETAALIGPAAGVQSVDRDELPTRVDLLVVLGGDGTLLSVADRIGDAGCETPILGVNFGRLGFLTEITLPELLPALEAVVDGTALVQRRAMLRVVARRGDTSLAEHVVLNDVVMSRGTISRLIYLAVYVDDRFVTNVKADGLIVATPTGSTAYNLAAGGPIVHPAVETILITPIAPHSLGNRPIAIPGRAKISIRTATDIGRDEIYATFDGQTVLPFETGDELIVTPAERPLTLLGLPTRGYYDTLREKLRWGDR